MVMLCSFKCAWCSKLWNSVLLITYSEFTKNNLIPSTFPSAKSSNCFWPRIWFEKGHWRLACEASLLVVSPSTTKVFFPCNVVKKTHRAWMWKSLWWNVRFVKFLKFLYCAAVSHHWNRRLCAEMKIDYCCSVHKSVSKNCTL